MSELQQVSESRRVRGLQQVSELKQVRKIQQVSELKQVFKLQQVSELQYPTGIPVAIPVTSGIRGFGGIPVPAEFNFLPGFLTGILHSI